MTAPKHEKDDYSPVNVQERPSGFERSAEKFAGELATPKDSTPLDNREMLSNIPENMEVELSLMNGISDIVEAHLKEFLKMKQEPMTKEEEVELRIAIKGMRAVQKHLYQNWMGRKGWRAEHLVRGLEAVSVSEGLIKRKDDSTTDKIKKVLHIG